ncbi:CPBP family glutamic-type intramembrane protease [Nocardiopsis sp. RSe5-2]|uniref:CPBP family glutamic-type intramembrane protease n=1 Tax=Nocardiopsis endophytica TaxID=3018445 RepID=A0ABT4TZF3_9ACTN|nr:CPBP family glutamic-type intramembrane protease [Nocardiopsis endophytica]MDA2809796.1 CPBP family glutamic-type intramembrane protease [Nocardiopsis endophytica]
MPAALSAYLPIAAPGLVLLVACLAAGRRVREPLWPVLVLVLAFILVRDAMTPAGLWRLGTGQGVLWIRFAEDPWSLAALGAGALAATAAMLALLPDLRRLVRWCARPGPLAAGAAGGVLAAAPLLLAAAGTPPEARGGEVAAALLPALLLVCAGGNLAEEVLFRGFLQGRLEQETSPLRAALASALLFAACHSFLASVVTGAGWPLLAFTFYEGLICALLRMRWGVAPAAVAHTVAILLLAGGLP